MANLLKFTLLLINLTIYLSAQDFGTHGKTFPIEEEDLISYIHKQIASLDSDDLLALHQKVQDAHTKKFQKPKPVPGLKEATHYEVHYFDPTITLKKDIKDIRNQILIKKGTTFNPLEQVSLDQDLLFFNGDQEEHRAWAEALGPNTKWILTNGQPLRLEEQAKRPVFFDQFGTLTRKLAIKAVPARVSQEGKKLKIEEIPLMEATCDS